MDIFFFNHIFVFQSLLNIRKHCNRVINLHLHLQLIFYGNKFNTIQKIMKNLKKLTKEHHQEWSLWFNFT